MNLSLELPELVGLDFRSSSCFRKLEVEEHISLFPCFLGRIGQGILEHLDRRVMRFSDIYGGVLLAYSTPQILQTTGKIMDELPHLHFNIRYIAYIFKPVIGSVLSGRINKLGSEHIGCLVYQCFNASVNRRISTKRDIASNGLTAADAQFEIGSDIYFTVVGVDVVDNVLSIKGERITEDGAGGDGDGAETTTGRIKKHKKHKHRHSKREKVHETKGERTVFDQTTCESAIEEFSQEVRELHRVSLDTDLEATQMSDTLMMADRPVPSRGKKRKHVCTSDEKPPRKKVKTKHKTKSKH